MNAQQIRARLAVLADRGDKRANDYRRRGVITAGNTWEEILEAERLHEMLSAISPASSAGQPVSSAGES